MHSHRLDDVRDSLLAAKKAYGWAQHVIQAVKVNDIESSQSAPAKPDHTEINRKSAVASERGQVDRLDTIQLQPATPFAGLVSQIVSRVLAKAQVRSENGHLMTLLGQASSKRAHFDHRAAFFLEGIIRLHDVQYVHGRFTFAPSHHSHRGPASPPRISSIRERKTSNLYSLRTVSAPFRPNFVRKDSSCSNRSSASAASPCLLADSLENQF